MIVDFWPEAASPLERLIENVFLQAGLSGHNVALYDTFCSCQHQHQWRSSLLCPQTCESGSSSVFSLYKTSEGAQ